LAVPIVELLCYAASGLCLVGGIVFVERERAQGAEASETLRSGANRDAVSRFGGGGESIATETIKTETVYVEVPVEVERRVEVTTIPTNPLDNPPLLQLIEETVRLEEEMYLNTSRFNAERREVSDHVLAKLHEILERTSGVEIVDPSPGDAFQRGMHRTESGKPPTPGAKVASVSIPGVRVSLRVLRPAVVEIAEP
jgi:hypothetical protein